MAINLFSKYGSRANPPSIDYPQGSVKNRSAPDVKDGTPLDADWANDHQGFFQSILSYFGVTANGTPDKVGASQYFDALMSDPSESKRGMPLAATNAEVAAGTNNGKMVTPAGLKSHLGTAATRNVGTASGNVMEVGSFGLGGNGNGVFIPVTGSDLNTFNTVGFYGQTFNDGAFNGANYPVQTAGGLDVLPVGAYGETSSAQYYRPFDSNRIFYRTCNNGTFLPWVELYHTGNLQLPLGQWQTWQDVTTSRALNTNYTNTTGRSIFVAVVCSGDHGLSASEIFVNDIRVGLVSDTSGVAGNSDSQMTAIVPSGATYRINSSGNIQLFAELR